MIETTCQALIRHILFSGHVTKSSLSHLLLKPTHITAAAVCVLSLKEVVDGHGIVTSHRHTILTMVRVLHVALLDIVEETSRDSCDATLITSCLILDHHITAHLKRAVGPSSGRGSHLH